MARSSRSTRLIGDRGRRTYRFLSSNWWRAGVMAVFVVGVVGYSGFYVFQYSEAASLEDQAKSECGSYGVKASVSTAQCIAARVLDPTHNWGSSTGSTSFGYLRQLWNQESGWRWNADNPFSTAYGIPQSLPGSKMGSVYCAHENWVTNATCQMRWGENYIESRYGSPRNAWAHEQAYNWY